MVTKISDSDLGLIQQVLKIFVHHKCVSLEVVMLRGEFERVADLFELEVRDVEVDCVEVVRRVREKPGFCAGRAF